MAVAAVATLVFAWWAVSLPPFSGLATAVVVGSGAAVAAWGVRAPARGPSGPSERGTQGPSGPSERGTQGPSGPSERGTQGPSGPSERVRQSPPRRQGRTATPWVVLALAGGAW
ncbi:MAG: hypothetical protein KY439_02495, partial [Actinobacteria bacterium]|nr:hypothetical protein [Actinomycetota bacterium]